MVFIQTLNKFCNPIKNTKDIEFINSIYNWCVPKLVDRLKCEFEMKTTKK
jgi:hypothetical protein